MQRIQGEALDNFYLLKEFHVLQRRKLSTHGGEKEHCLTLVSPIRSVKQLSRGSKVHQLAVVLLLFRRPQNARLTASTTRALLSISIHEKNIIQLLHPLTREALTQLALPSTQSTKPKQLLEDDLPSPADMSSQATASEDQSQVSTPFTITADLPAFEHELRRRKVLDADAEEIIRTVSRQLGRNPKDLAPG